MNSEDDKQNNMDKELQLGIKNKEKHKKKFIEVLKELLKKIKKGKPVEDSSTFRQQERQSKNGNPSGTLQTNAKNISRDKEKEAGVKKECSASGSSVQSDIIILDMNKNEETESVSGEILKEKQPDNDSSAKSYSTDDIYPPGADTSTGQGTECKSILITGLSPTTTAEDTLIYFQSNKASGGGDAEIEIFDETRRCAVLSFDESEAFKSVIDRAHNILGKKVCIEKYLSTTFSLSFVKLSPTVIDEAFHGLSEILVNEKAFFRKHETDRALVVVCLEGEHLKVFTMVTKYLDSLKEKEFRKTYQTKTVKDIDHKRMLLLEQIGFVNSIQHKHANLHVNLDIKQRELHLTGPDEQVSDALKQYCEITEKSFELGTYVARMATNELWKQRFLKTLKDEGIKGTICFDEANSNSIKIIALTSVDCESVERSLCESLAFHNLPLSKENQNIVESQDFEHFCLKLKDGNHLDIQVDMSNGIGLCGFPDVVASAKEKIEHFIETEQIHSKSLDVSSNAIKLLVGHLSSNVKEIEESLKQKNVSIVIDRESGKVEMKGTRGGLSKCDELVKELLLSIVEKREEFSSPGLAKLLLRNDGQEQLKLIEVEKNVAISVGKCARQQERQPKPKSRLQSSRRFSNFFQWVDFTTKEGVKVLRKKGCIEKERVDILVNSAHSNLNNRTACGKRLSDVGGPAFVKACEVHTNIPVGDTVCTTSGDLQCQFVIHAVCCNWDKTDKAKEVGKLRRRKVNSALGGIAQENHCTFNVDVK